MTSIFPKQPGYSINHAQASLSLSYPFSPEA